MVVCQPLLTMYNLLHHIGHTWSILYPFISLINESQLCQIQAFFDGKSRKTAFKFYFLAGNQLYNRVLNIHLVMRVIFIQIKILYVTCRTYTNILENFFSNTYFQLNRKLFSLLQFVCKLSLLFKNWNVFKLKFWWNR